MFRLSPVNHVSFPIFNGWLDLVALSDIVLEGISGPHPDEGWDIKLTITNYIAPATDPDFGKSGISMRWTVTFPGEPDWSYWIMFDKDAAEFSNGIPFDIFQVLNDPIALFDDDKDPVLNPSWVTVVPNNFAFTAMSECWLFPELVDPEGFAEFNGVDSYIKNRSRTNDTTGAWRQEFDVRLHDTGQHHYLCKSFNTTRFNVIYENKISYINREVTFSTSLTLNQWYHVDFRYQWDAADGLYRVAIDGGADDTAANSNFNAKWDQFGKRAGQPPVGEFDLKNFVLRNGTAASSTVYLDQNFDINACDDGPDGRHGDTFNMPLASCP